MFEAIRQNYVGDEPKDEESSEEADTPRNLAQSPIFEEII
jgi:hypothetical protein